MPGEVKDPMQGNGKKPVMDSLALEKDTLKTRRTTLEISVVWCALITGYQQNQQQSPTTTLNTVFKKSS